jgi:hypothetical protein
MADRWRLRRRALAGRHARGSREKCGEQALGSCRMSDSDGRRNLTNFLDFALAAAPRPRHHLSLSNYAQCPPRVGPAHVRMAARKEGYDMQVRRVSRARCGGDAAVGAAADSARRPPHCISLTRSRPPPSPCLSHASHTDQALDNRQLRCVRGARCMLRPTQEGARLGPATGDYPCSSDTLGE